jgi:hypothetical protein
LEQAIEWLKIEQMKYSQKITEDAQKELEETLKREEEKKKKLKLHWQRRAYN